MSGPFLIVSQSDSLIQIADIKSNSEWQTVQIQISCLLQNPTDQDLHCLQKQGIFGFSRTNVNNLSLVARKRLFESISRCKYLGPVVQSVVSLTSWLRAISLTVLADSIYNMLIFFAKKMWVAFALLKLLTFFQQKISVYLRITRCKLTTSLALKNWALVA